MSVYVDDIIDWGSKLRAFKGGSCHMYADTLEELHVLAQQIGLKRAWFQGHHKLPHYDLNKNKRLMAVRAGAIETDGRHAVETMNAND